jgi:hypothetical protein
MLRHHWKTLTIWALAVYVIALWAFELAGFPTQGEICEVTAAGQDCASYNILFATAWKIARIADHWSAFITALATVAIAWFTLTIRHVNESQLAHSHQVERAYISGGGAPEARETDLGTQTIAGTIGGATTISLGKTRTLTGNFVVCVNNYGKTAGELRWLGIGFCEARNFQQPRSTNTFIAMTGFNREIGGSARALPRMPSRRAFLRR